MNPTLIDLNDYVRSGEGANGASYNHKTDPNIMLKIYFRNFEAAAKELELARKVYEMGIPTPEPGDLITDGERLGIRHFDADSADPCQAHADGSRCSRDKTLHTPWLHEDVAHRVTLHLLCHEAAEDITMCQRESLREGEGQAGDRVLVIRRGHVLRMDAEYPPLRIGIAAEEAVASRPQLRFEKRVLPHIQKCCKAAPCATPHHVLNMGDEDAVSFLLLHGVR